MEKMLDMQTPNPDISEEENEYDILYKNRKYHIKFSFNSDIISFTIYPPKKLNKTNQSRFLYRNNIEKLRQNSQILGLYNNSDIVFLINELFRQNKIYLEQSEDNKNELNLEIKLNVLNKEEILILPLEQKKMVSNGYIVIENELKENKFKNIENKYDIMMDQINNIEQKFSSEIDNFNKEIKEIKMNNEYLNKQIILITNQISKLNEKIENDINNKNDIIKKGNKYKFEKLLQRIELLEEDKNDINNENIVIDKEDINEGINVLKKIIKKKEEKNMEKLRNCFINKSKIILKEDDIDFIINRLNKYNPISFKLIFKSCTDGDSIKTFHEKCDGEDFILIIIETNKGYKFGGFTSIGFDSSGFELNDDNAFLFSIDKKKIYEINPGNAAVYCNKRFGPIFCSKKDDTNYNICISDNFLSNISTTSKKSECYKVDEEYELNFGEKDFIIKELEIYKLDLVNY
jgi:hypothetical protein